MNKTDKFLKHHAFWVALNMNDTFEWACADSEQIDIKDLSKLIEVEEKFGFSGVNAFVAGLRNCDVLDHPSLRTKEYYAAQKYLKGYKTRTQPGSAGFFHSKESASLGDKKHWWEIWK